MINEILLFGMPTNPLEWVIILAVILLLFGGSKLPQLAKALGQSKRAFKEGLDEAEEEAQREKTRPTLTTGQPARQSLSAVDDEELFEEARRRAERLRVNDTTRLEGDKSTPSQTR